MRRTQTKRLAHLIYEANLSLLYHDQPGNHPKGHRTGSIYPPGRRRHPLSGRYHMGIRLRCGQSRGRQTGDQIKGRTYSKPLIVLGPESGTTVRSRYIRASEGRYLTARAREASDHYLPENKRTLSASFRPGWFHCGPDRQFRILSSSVSFLWQTTNFHLCQSIRRTFPCHFWQYQLGYHQAVDFTLPAFTEKDITGKASVLARYDENGELEFLR